MTNENAIRFGTDAKGVASFYERHPYPPPIADLAQYETLWDDARRLADSHLFWPDRPYREDRSILVAGCGTSQAAKHALRWPRAKVTGIDFSASSIEQTARLKRQHNIANLELVQLPVEEATALDRHFDHIICTGVLHHLPDPDAGLQALCDVLAPNGAMYLMLYAPYGRTGVYMLQDYCRRLGIGATSEEISKLADSLQLLPTSHPLAPLLRNARDFFSDAGLADALLHPQDRAYSIPQLFHFLGNAGLSFGRWIRQAPYLPHCGVLVQSPHHAILAALPAEEQFTAIELYRGSMVEHSLVAYHNGKPNPQAIDFSGDAWLNYIPIRLPDTIIVEERLPPGAAAVLINRGHTFTDIYLPIDALQKAMFNTIDGGRSIADLADTDEHREVARNFFQQLWHYDQVVFNRSRSSKVEYARAGHAL